MTHTTLLAIVRLADEAYGRAILKEVQAGLEDKRLVSSRLGPGTPVRAGRARRYYRLQPAGVRALNDARAAVDTIWHGLTWPLKGRA